MRPQQGDSIEHEPEVFGEVGGRDTEVDDLRRLLADQAGELARQGVVVGRATAFHEAIANENDTRSMGWRLDRKVGSAETIEVQRVVEQYAVRLEFPADDDVTKRLGPRFGDFRGELRRHVDGAIEEHLGHRKQIAEDGLLYHEDRCQRQHDEERTTPAGEPLGRRPAWWR